MNNFTFAIIVAALSASSAYAQPLALNGPLTAPAPFTKQARSLQSRAITKVAQRATRFGQKAQSVFETFAPQRIKVHALSSATQSPIWTPRHEVVYERSYKGGDWYLSEDITNYYDETGRNYGFKGMTTDKTEAHPYYRQMTTYDAQGRRSVVTDEVSDDGVTFTPNWRYTYTYDTQVPNFVTEEKCQMWNGKEYVDTINGAGFKRVDIERDAQGRVLSASNYYMSLDYSEPDLQSRLTATYTEGQPNATSIKIEEQDYDYDKNAYVLKESSTYSDIVWVVTDNQYVATDASFMQGDQRLASAHIYNNGEQKGSIVAKYDEQNPEDYSYVIDTQAGKHEFKVWTVDDNGSYRWENLTTYYENDWQGSGWDLDSTIVNYDSHHNMVLYERYQNSDVKVANGDPAELSDGEKYTISYNDVYDMPDSVLFTGWRYVSTDPENPWNSEPMYVDLKNTKYSDFVDATTGAGSETGIAATTTMANCDMTRTTEGIKLTATGKFGYRVYDVAGRIITSGTANGQTTISQHVLPAGTSIVQVTTAQGTQSWKVQ